MPIGSRSLPGRSPTAARPSGASCFATTRSRSTTWTMPADRDLVHWQRASLHSPERSRQSRDGRDPQIGMNSRMRAVVRGVLAGLDLDGPQTGVMGASNIDLEVVSDHHDVAGSQLHIVECQREEGLRRLADHVGLKVARIFERGDERPEIEADAVCAPTVAIAVQGDQPRTFAQHAKQIVQTIPGKILIQ